MPIPPKARTTTTFCGSFQAASSRVSSASRPMSRSAVCRSRSARLPRWIPARQNLDEIAQDGGAETFLIEKLAAIVPERADALIMLVLRLRFGGVEDEAVSART